MVQSAPEAQPWSWAPGSLGFKHVDDQMNECLQRMFTLNLDAQEQWVNSPKQSELTPRWELVLKQKNKKQNSSFLVPQGANTASRFISSLGYPYGERALVAQSSKLPIKAHFTGSILSLTYSPFPHSAPGITSQYALSILFLPIKFSKRNTVRKKGCWEEAPNKTLINFS